MLNLVVISQEKMVLTAQADQVTAVTASGEITVLPDHIPLFSKLVLGELRYSFKGENHHLLVSNGFLDVGADNTVTVIVDSASLSRDLSEQKAQEAIKAAHNSIKTSKNAQELVLAEASLKLALLEIKVAQKTKRTQI